MIRVRKIDELLVDAFYAGRLAGPFYHSQQGQEAIGVGVCTFLNPDDYIWYTHRGHGLCEVISKGLPRENSLPSIMARQPDHAGELVSSIPVILIAVFSAWAGLLQANQPWPPERHWLLR